MDSSRYQATAVEMDDGKQWIAGGYINEQLSSRGDILQAGSFSNGPTLPRATSDHCMARVSATEYILAGGESIDDKAYLYSTESGRWTTLDPMSVDRVGLGCEVFTSQGTR